MAKIEHVERVVLAVRKLQQSVLFSIAMHIAVLKDEDVCVVVCYSFFFFSPVICKCHPQAALFLVFTRGMSLMSRCRW